MCSPRSSRRAARFRVTSERPDKQIMTAWTRHAKEPFASNDDFFRSVSASVDALPALVFATVLTIILGPLAAIAFVVPIALLARAGWCGSRSARVTRATFPTTDAWRRAERQAVASVLVQALFRPRWTRVRA